MRGVPLGLGMWEPRRWGGWGVGLGFRGFRNREECWIYEKRFGHFLKGPIQKRKQKANRKTSKTLDSVSLNEH